jgi:hypothetical protein
MSLSVARELIPAYSSRLFRRDFTQHQHFALMALREFFKVDYRSLEQILGGWAERREVLGLERVSSHSTVQKSAERLLEKGGLRPPKRGRCAARAPRLILDKSYPSYGPHLVGHRTIPSNRSAGNE